MYSRSAPSQLVTPHTYLPANVITPSSTEDNDKECRYGSHTLHKHQRVSSESLNVVFEGYRVITLHEGAAVARVVTRLTQSLIYVNFNARLHHSIAYVI